MTTGALFAAIILLVALSAALAASLFALGGMRSGLRRVRDQVSELRKHPMVGALSPESASTIRALNRTLNDLIDDLRHQVAQTRTRALSLESFADGPPDMALIGIDADWQVDHFNSGAGNLTAWPREEILGRHVEILFAPGEWERLLPKLARRSILDQGLVDKFRLQRRDGTVVSTRVSVQRSGGETREREGLLLTARDLTEEEILEHRLRSSEERYRRLVEEVRDGVMILREGRLIYANPALCRMLDMERSQLEAAPFKDLIHARDLLPLLESLGRAESGVQPDGESNCRLISAGGAEIEARLRWAVGEFSGGRALYATVVDLTERGRSERALQENESRLRATLHATGDGVLVIEDSRDHPAVTVANRAFCVLFGVAPERLIGQGESEAIAVMLDRVADPVRLREFLEGARSSPEIWLEGIEIANPRRALVDLLAAPIGGPTGGRIGWILTVRDVTARVVAERRLKSNLEELAAAKTTLESTCGDLSQAREAAAKRNLQLEELNSELRSLDEMKSNLLANVSHELHTPLVSIKGYTEMIVRRKLGPLTQEQERGLSVAMRNIDRLIEMIDNLLSFARLEQGETQLTLVDVPLWQLVDEAIELVGERVKKKNLTVTTRYETDDLEVRGDRTKLGQVFINLMTNAVKFNRDGGCITVTARHGSRGLVDVEVADTGIGIAAGETERIFERFYQTESGSGRRYEGTGIGLSIVRDILRLHGGTIRVTSDPGKGSAFSFTLPLARHRQPSNPSRPARRQRSVD